MSGEVVVVSALSGTVGLGVLASGGGVAVAVVLVTKWIERERELAGIRMREERQKRAQWQRHHAAEQARVQQLVGQREKTRAALQGLALGQSVKRAESDARPTADAFVGGSGKTLERELAPLLATIPAEVLDDAHSPFARLKQDMVRYDKDAASGKQASKGRLEAFRHTVEMTVSAFLEDMDRRVDAAKALLEQTESLLSEVICYRNLANDAAQVTELVDIENHLLALLEAGEATATSVSVLHRKFAELKRPIDEQLELRGIRVALESSLEKHLSELGYRPMQAQMSAQSTWAVPGGELVSVNVHDDLRMGFQLIHEREKKSAQAMNEQELAFLRQQEKRWCQDLHELVRRLNKDGFSLNIDFERESPDESIPVVVVEEADEWIEHETKGENLNRQDLP